MGWSSEAKTAAARRYGEANYSRYAARRKAGWLLLLGAGAVVGLVVLARAGVHAAAPHVRAMSLPHPSWHQLLVIGWLAGVLLLARLATKLHNPYRVRRTRRSFLSRY
jgi:hypothetical protein